MSAFGLLIPCLSEGLQKEINFCGLKVSSVVGLCNEHLFKVYGMTVQKFTSPGGMDIGEFMPEGLYI